MSQNRLWDFWTFSAKNFTTNKVSVDIGIVIKATLTSIGIDDPYYRKVDSKFLAILLLQFYCNSLQFFPAVV